MAEIVEFVVAYLNESPLLVGLNLIRDATESIRELLEFRNFYLSRAS